MSRLKRQRQHVIQENKEKKAQLTAEFKKMNDAIAQAKDRLTPFIAECNAEIGARVPGAGLEISIERLYKQVEDRLVLKGNLGDLLGPFTLATVTADLEGKLFISFKFCEQTRMEISVERLVETVKKFGRDPIA